MRTRRDRYASESEWGRDGRWGKGVHWGRSRAGGVDWETGDGVVVSGEGGGKGGGLSGEVCGGGGGVAEFVGDRKSVV